MAEGGGQEQVSGSTPAVFVSYATADKAVADSIVAALEQGGIKCWIAPRDVTPGVFYADAIVQALNTAQLLIAVMSAHSVGSQHVMREVERASSKKRPIVVFRLDATPLPTGLEYFLSASHWLDASNLPIEGAVSHLVGAVRQVLALPAPRAAPASLERPGVPIPASHHGIQALKRTAGAWILLIGLLLLVGGGLLWVASRPVAQRAESSPVKQTTIAAAAAAAAATPAIPEKSVAVLPFVDMSENKDQEYFSDGLSEELIDALAKIPDLRVPARTSSFYFKGKQTSIAEIARMLGVANVLEGSVRKSGNTLRITAQLIRADNGYHLWSETYDRPLGNIFKIQDEIAAAVVKELKSSVLQGSGFARSGTKDVDAYSSYLQARAIFGGADTKEAFEKAVRYAEQSLRRDPTFAQGWVLLANILSVQAAEGMSPRKEGMEKARRAIQRALNIDPQLSEAHASLAQIHLLYDWDWSAGEAQAYEALKSDPDGTSAMSEVAFAELLRGRVGQSIAWQLKVVSKDPINAQPHYALGHAYLRAGNLDAASREVQKAVDLEPGVSEYRAFLADLLLKQGENAAAIAELGRVSDEGMRVGGLAIVYQAMKRNGEADQALAQFERKFGATDAYTLASIHAYRMEFDQAFTSLDRAYMNRESALPWIKTDPDFRNLWSDPRFMAFLKKMNL